MAGDLGVLICIAGFGSIVEKSDFFSNLALPLAKTSGVGTSNLCGL